MDAGTSQGSEIFQPIRRLTALVAVVCSLYGLPAVQQSAHGAEFRPSTPIELVDAFAVAGANEEDDVIYLGGQTFELTDELILAPDDGYSLGLRDGTLERTDESRPYRLLNLLAVPIELPSNMEVGGSPVIIEGVQFKNGLYRGDNLSAGIAEGIAAGSAGGGGALLSNRKTIINNARFENNRVLGSGLGGAIKHTKFLEISKALFVNNHATTKSKYRLAQGGAIASDAGARLFVGHGYFVDNTADRGGAIYASSKVVDLNITRTAFNNNVAQTNGGAIWSDVGEGGVRISNSSFIGNQAPMGGGAFYTQAKFADITLFHLTMWGNKSGPGLGASIRALTPRNGSRFSLRNSVIANNIGGNCSGIKEVNLSIDLSSHNLSDDNSCGMLGIDEITDTFSIFSGTFDYHGGSIPTMPIAKNSPVRNRVPRANCLSFDSRDIERLDHEFLPDEFCDAGAFEYIPEEFIDMDGDEVGNSVDNCMRVSNPLQSDIDADGRGDECDGRDDRDSDQDVILNFRDNCPGMSNFLQVDRNGNGVGDACEQSTVHLTLAPVLY